MIGNNKLDWKHVINSIKDCLLLLDANGIIKECNTVFLKTINMPSNQVIGANCYEIIPSKGGKTEDCPYFKSKISKKRESSNIQISGKWFRVDADPIIDEDNEISGYVQLMSDITERKKAEDALKKEKEYYHTFITALNDWVWEMDLKGIHTYSNPAVESILGYKADEVVGHHVTKLWIESDKQNDSSKILEKVLSKGKGWKHAVGRFQHKDGAIITTESSAIPIYNSEKKIIGYRGVDHDITERIKAELALKESEIRFRSIFSNISNIAVQGYDKDRKVIFWNKASERLYGYSQKETINKKLEDLIIPTKMRADVISMVHNWHEKNIQIPSGELILIKKDNSPVHVFSSHVMIEKSNGEKEMFCIDIDITERKQAEKALTTSEESLRALFNAMTDVVLELDHEGKYIDIAPTSPDLLYKPSSEILGKTVHEIFSKKEADKFLSVIHKSLDEVKVETIQYPLKIKNKLIWFEGRVTPKTKNTVLLIAHDITERKRTELALQENERRYKYLFNQSPTSIWEEDFSDVYRYLTSLKKSGIKDFKEYFENHLDEVKKCSEMVRILDINEMTVQLFNAKSKEDLITNLNSIFTKDSMSPFIDQLCAIAENHTHYDGETVNMTLDGELLNVYIKLNVVPGYEKDYSRVLISLMDITGQKKAEEGLRSGRERLKLLNQIIRHDLSNDFIVIKSAINIFRRSTEEKMIDEIERRADKSLETIDTYRKYESFIDSNADLNKIEVVDLINELKVEFANVKFKIEGNCNVFADDALNSIFTNLITNSIKHGNASQIDINISSKNNMCKIMFKDNGTGIPAKIKNKIFDEGFFYGKAGHTGIGLHIVKETIERYGGTISVEDNTPSGTVFIINLRKAL